jgi:hypothetical protein
MTNTDTGAILFYVRGYKPEHIPLLDYDGFVSARIERYLQSTEEDVRLDERMAHLHNSLRDVARCFDGKKIPLQMLN